MAEDNEKKTEDMTDDEKAAAEWESMLSKDTDAEGGDSAQAAAEGVASGNASSSDEDAAAAEWESMMNSGGGDGTDSADDKPKDTTKILSQDEIDALLGFSAVEEKEATGIRAILDKSLGTYEKLPMLEVVFDRLVRMMSTSLRNFTSDNVDISIDSITSLRFGDYLNSIPLPALLIIFKALEWDNYGLITVDSSLIYSIVDVLLGGRRANMMVKIEGRPYSTIEQELIKSLIEVALADMSAAFDPISPVTFSYDRIETNPRFATIARPANAAILIRLRIDMEERGGNMEILFPHATLEPIRDLLLQMFMGEKFGRDSIWEAHLSKELKSTDVAIDALLHEKQMLLGEVVNFKIGTTILLDCQPDEDITVRCGGVPVMVGKIGRVGEKMAIKVHDKINRTPEEIQE